MEYNLRPRTNSTLTARGERWREIVGIAGISSGLVLAGGNSSCGPQTRGRIARAVCYNRVGQGSESHKIAECITGAMSGRAAAQDTQNITVQLRGRTAGQGTSKIVAPGLKKRGRPAGQGTSMPAAPKRGRPAGRGASTATKRGHGTTTGQVANTTAVRGKNTAARRGTSATAAPKRGRPAGQRTNTTTEQGTRPTAGRGSNTATRQITNTVDGQGTSTSSRQGTHTATGRGKRGRLSTQGSRRSSGNGPGTTSTNKPTGLEYNSDGSDMMTEDKIFALYTRAVESPPDDLCPICLESLQEPTLMWGATSLDNHQPKDSTQESLTLELSQCLHIFHRECARQLLRHGRSFLECPLCKTIHGVRVGSQPTNGHMKVYTIPDNLPGYPDCGTYVITYIFHGGIQGSEHPNPGEAYIAWAFPRTAYLPANQEGTKVVRLLQEAWKRRLIFRVGRSATTGMENVITWSDIHHKTNRFHNHNGHGYPDQNHLNNILAELIAVGVSEENIDSTNSS